MKQERETRLVARIRVEDSSGEQHTVIEHGDFVRVRYMDGTWSEWSRSSGRLLMKGQHINPTGDGAVFEVAATGEKLKVLSPRA